MSRQPRLEVLRSPLGRARGLGSARAGSHDWWIQRVLSLVLAPLTVWFIFSVIRLAGRPHQAVVDWLSNPLSLGLMLILIVGSFYHLLLGLQVILEDYVHAKGVKLASVLLMKSACVLLALLCVVSVLKIGL